MHYISLTTGIVLSLQDNIQPGDYLVEDTMGGQLVFLCNGGTMTPLTESRPFDEKKDWIGKRVLVVRGGGFGDLILLTPVLREIKRRWPAAHIAVATMSRYAPVLHNLPFVDEVITYPTPKAVANTYDAWVFFEGVIENDHRAKKVHMTDLFAELTGISGIKDKKPEYVVSDHEKIWAMEGYPRINGTRRLCVQVGASAACRVYPHDQLSKVCSTLHDKGWEIFLLGEPGEIKTGDAKGIRNLSAHGLTFRQSCAVILSSDCVVGPDSALIHVAGTLGVPAVGLYGPFPWKLRTAYCPTTFCFQGKGACAPCFHHKHLNNHWPKDGPCNKSGRCDVLSSIKPESIAAKIEQIAKKFELCEI